MRKGISQEIAIMVIIAVTISIAAVFIGWLHTLMSKAVHLQKYTRSS